MEWFPNHVTEQEDDGSNPDGTAIIEINVATLLRMIIEFDWSRWKAHVPIKTFPVIHFKIILFPIL